MQVSELKIDRFGIWQDLNLHLGASQLNVFYGPNEAGKTTLMRFVQGVMFGFDRLPAEHLSHRKQAHAWSGSLLAEHRAELYELLRTTDARHPQGSLQITAASDHRSDEQMLATLLQGVDRRTYEHVFAVGLHELQELATLNETEAAQSLYDLTLGAEGKALVRAIQDVDRRSAELVDQRPQQGRIRHLLSRRKQLQDELDSLADLRDQFHTRNESREQLESQVAKCQRKLDEVDQQLKAHQYLDRVWRPWSRVRDLETELRSMPDFHGFPENAESKLNELEAEIRSAEQLRQAALNAAQQLKHQGERAQNQDGLLRHAGTIQGYLDLRGWLEDLEAQMDQTRQRVDSSHRELENQLTQLGEGWSADQVAHTDTSPQATVRLLELARALEKSRGKSRRARKLMGRLARRLQKRRSHFTDQLEQRHVKSLEQAIDKARRRIDQLRELGSLRIKREQLEQQQLHLDHRLNNKSESSPLPGWVNGVMGAFLIVGVILTVFGAIEAINVSWMAGIIYMLLGLTWIGFRYGIKQHLTTTESIDADELRQHARECSHQLATVRQQILVLERQLGLDDSAAGSEQGDISSLTQLLSLAIQDHAELERLASAMERYEHQRERMKDMKGRLQSTRREYERSLHAWREQQRVLGIDSRLSVEQSFHTWQRIVIAAQKRVSWNRARRELEGLQRSHEAHARRMSELARRIGQSAAAQLPPLKLLDAWADDLQHLDRFQDEQSRLRQEEQQKRREAAEYLELIEESRRQQSVLLVRAGAHSREEFEQRALLRMRRQEIVEQLDRARSELKAISQDEPPVAITEQDLMGFDTNRNREQIERWARERQELEQTIRSAHEQLGSIKRDIESCEDDRRQTQLRYELAQIDAELRDSAEEWFALQTGHRVVDRLREYYELNQQPATLKRASDYLRKLTRGRYESIWCPLGSQRLCVLAQNGDSFGLDQLSGGTREQLFLAIRMALIENFSAEGIELPIILDDLFVNFDQLRTEAAVDTLIEFAGSGRQVLFFTCHLHLAHLFESKGIDPTWLPTRSHAAEERRAG